uniref:Uncharacterized protein n=1 Tax=Rhodopseudomonas palustris (strain BisA53) TaxID=316055 RepID=Q07KR5_RHOP5
MREKLLEKLQSLVEQSSAAPPVVELDDYFVGNAQEDSIAPNQIGDGRPSLADLHAALRAIRDRPDVQAVLVGIHGDWVESLKCDDVWPAADNVHIYASAGRSTVEGWVAGFAHDGVLKGWPYGMHPAAPKPQRGYHVYTICWD